MVGDTPKAGVGASVDQSLDVAFELLADRRRRYVLACLKDHSGPIAVPDLARNVAVHENGGSRSAIPNEEVATVHTSLHHNHIPKLADADAVEFDQDRDVVQVSESSALLELVQSLNGNDESQR